MSALSYSIIEERCPPAPVDVPFPNNRVVGFVLAQHRRMPDYLRWPMRALTLAFDALALFRHRRRFHRLGHRHRWQQILRWKGSRLSAQRDFIKFYESLTVFAWYAEVDRVDER